MFALKKIIISFVLPPGILVLVLTVAGLVFMFARKRKICGIFLIAVGLATWIFSTGPFADLFLRGLTSAYSLPTNPSADVLILLGGGFSDQADDLTGKGFPDGDMLARIVTAARLQKKLKIPLIITDRDGLADTSNGARITKRLLMDLGVNGSKIIIEDKARDTFENAKFSKAICDAKGFVRPMVVTSAFHLKRACLAFKQVGLEVIPFASFLIRSEKKRYGWYSFLPRAGSLLGLSRALHEYLGLWVLYATHRVHE